MYKYYKFAQRQVPGLVLAKLGPELPADAEAVIRFTCADDAEYWHRGSMDVLTAAFRSGVDAARKMPTDCDSELDGILRWFREALDPEDELALTIQQAWRLGFRRQTREEVVGLKGNKDAAYVLSTGMTALLPSFMPCDPFAGGILLNIAACWQDVPTQMIVACLLSLFSPALCEQAFCMPCDCERAKRLRKTIKPGGILDQIGKQIEFPVARPSSPKIETVETKAVLLG